MESNKKFSTDEIDLLEIAILIKRNIRQIIIITIAFSFLSIIYSLLATKWYTAAVKIMPGGTEKGSSLLSKYSGLAAITGIDMPSTSSQYNLYPDIIKSNFILDRILEHKFKTKKYTNPVNLFQFWELEIDSSAIDWKHILNEEAKKILREDYIQAEIDPKSNLLTLAVFVPEDPLFAAELANFIAKNLELYNKIFRNYKASDQVKYIEKSIKAGENDLNKAENHMKIFLENNKDHSSPEKRLKYEKLVTDLEVQRTIYIELRKQKELAEIEKIKETETLNILEYATEPIKRYKPKRTIIVIITTFIGFILSILVVIGYDFGRKFSAELTKKNNGIT